MSRQPWMRFSQQRSSNYSGTQELGHEAYRDWLIVVQRRQVGMTIVRQQYSAVLRRTEPNHEQTLQGFGSAASAWQAARDRVDYFEDILQLGLQGPHHKLRRLWRRK